MQLPSVDRQPGSAPAGADLALASAARVIPVAPVNPVVTANPPGVVNRIGDGVAASNAMASPTYPTASDLGRQTPEAATSPKDWTIARPEPVKVEVPPPEPISKRLLDFLQAVWRASGNAVEVAQLQNQNVSITQNNPNASPGLLAKQDITYSASKIRKNEKL